MKKLKTIIAAILAPLAMVGCGSLMNYHYGHMSTDDLNFERYQISYRVNHGDTDDIDRKEKIERELNQRGKIKYDSEPHVIISPQ